MGASDIFWRCNMLLYYSCTREKYKCTSNDTHIHTHKQPRIMCFARVSKAATPSSTSILQFICKLHVSCYLWRDSRELCDLSSFSLIIAVMRIKAFEWALLEGLFLIHMHEAGRSQSLLCHPSYSEIRWDVINICDGAVRASGAALKRICRNSLPEAILMAQAFVLEMKLPTSKHENTRVSQRNVTHRRNQEPGMFYNGWHRRFPPDEGRFSVTYRWGMSDGEISSSLICPADTNRVISMFPLPADVVSDALRC